MGDPCKGPSRGCSADQPAATGCGGEGARGGVEPDAWFARMIPNCLENARAAHAAGRPIVGILCEYTPRELIMAAGAVPVCLCGGSAKTIPAAERHLPTNLCPLIKSTYGYHVERNNPFLEMAALIVAETTCDGKKKMYELLAESRPVYVLELPQKPDDDDAFHHWHRELVKFRDHLEERFAVTVTAKGLQEAIRTMNRERRLRRELAALMAGDPPPLSGRELLDYKSSISGIPADFQQYERALARFRTAPRRCDLAGRVRVLMTGVPVVHGAERVVDLIEGAGGLVVAMENCTGLKPILEDVDEAADDPLRALAEKYFHLPCSVMTCNDRRLETLAALNVQFRPQCVVELIWQACLTYDVESHRVRRFVEESLHLPYLRIETDYSPNDSARIATRIEALFETLADRPAPPR